MGEDNKLFEDAYQSVTAPFEETGASQPSSDQGETGAAEGTPEGSGIERQGGELIESQSSGEEKPAGEKKPDTGYDLESFNSYFQSEFKDESSLKELLASPSKLSEYETQLQTKDTELKAAMEKAQKYDDLIDDLDPKALYPDEEMYTFFKLKEKFPDKDPSMIAQIKSSSFDAMTDIDKLILADKLKVKSNVPDSVRQREILRRLDIDAENLTDLDDSDRYKLSAAVADHEQLFSEIRGFKPEPMKIDFTAEKEQRKKEAEARMADLKTKWDPLARSLMKNFTNTKAFGKNEKGDPVEIFNYSVEDKFREEFMGPYMKAIMDSGMEPTKENLQIAGNYLDERFKILNFDRIVSEAIKHGKTMTEDKAHDEIHSDKPQNTGEAPASQKDDGKQHTLAEWVKLKGGSLG